jgi:hypothetical protein
MVPVPTVPAYHFLQRACQDPWLHRERLGKDAETATRKRSPASLDAGDPCLCSWLTPIGRNFQPTPCVFVSGG